MSPLVNAMSPHRSLLYCDLNLMYYVGHCCDLTLIITAQVGQKMAKAVT